MTDSLLAAEKRSAFWLTLICCAIIFFGIGAAGGQLFFRLQAAQSTRHEICVQIERLKTAQRQQAQTNYAHLDANLKLLHLKKTPKIVVAALQARDEALHRFAPKSC